MIDKKKPSIGIEQIKQLLPHREPMLLIDNLYNIDAMKSAIGHLKITTDKFYVQGHFPGQPVMPGVMIVEAFGQAAATLAAYSLDPKLVKDKLVYLMSVQHARFRKPVMPPCDLYLLCKVDKIKGRIWKYKGEAFCNNEKMADAEWMATIVDRND